MPTVMPDPRAAYLTRCPGAYPQERFIGRATSAIARGETLPMLLAARLADSPDSVAMHCLGRSMTRRALDQRADALARWLRHGAGFAVGARLAVMLPNLLQFPVVALAAWRAGLVLVPVNPLYTARELAHQLVDSGAEGLVVLEQFAAVAQAALPGSSVRELIVTSVGDELGWPRGWLTDVVLRRVKRVVPPWSWPGARRWRAVLAAGHRLPPVIGDARPTDVAQLQYTGGTTGTSKGASLTHTALMANTAALEQWFGGAIEPGRDISLVVLPVYHIAAFSNLLYCLVHGVQAVLVPNARDLDSVIDGLVRWRPAVLGAVNTLFDALLVHPRLAGLDLSCLKVSIQGGTALRQRTAADWRARTGCRIVEMYGLSETSGAITANRWDGDNPPGTIGKPMAGVEASIRDASGAIVPDGEPGELCVRGAPLFSSYWNRPKETAEAHFADDWFRTGDIARCDADGHLHILDRRKDMILVSGFNVYPNEIEDVVAQHPGVLEAAAVGVPDERTGEAVRLVVVRRDPSLDEATLRAHCRSQLTGYKQPRVIEFRDQLPKSPVGKVLRRALRD